ncbi:hypothetical protein TIFTF001_016722 [Ficus carica]|uniref:Uncharacterized protein n=1 Tax=Ficus carica TaxID=3494 RepID=A0AA88A6T4_FICCA|nr:hypothetical protein TIFTF001_016722 [Ficus carica]
MLFESGGIPCSHIFTVIKHLSLPHVPDSLILPRWRKDVKATTKVPMAQQVLVPDDIMEATRLSSIAADFATLGMPVLLVNIMTLPRATTQTPDLVNINIPPYNSRPSLKRITTQTSTPMVEFRIIHHSSSSPTRYLPPATVYILHPPPPQTASLFSETIA